MNEVKTQQTRIRFMDLLPDGFAVVLGFSSAFYLLAFPVIDDFKAVGAFAGMAFSLGIQIYKLIEVKRIRREIDALKANREQHSIGFDSRLRQIEQKLENHE